MPEARPLQDGHSLGTRMCSAWVWAAYRVKKPRFTVQTPPASWEPSGPLQSPPPHHGDWLQCLALGIGRWGEREAGWEPVQRKPWMLAKEDSLVLTFNSLPALRTGKCCPSTPELYKADISKNPGHLLLKLLCYPWP